MATTPPGRSGGHHRSVLLSASVQVSRPPAFRSACPLTLGRDLADALDEGDVVGRWLAHHLADLLTRCEASPDDQELARTTREVILKLWEHKSAGGFRRPPYGHLAPVLDAPARLEPEPAPWRRYRTFSDDEKPPEGALERYPVLKTACRIDGEVGDLVRLAVAVAAMEATSAEEPWVIAGSALAANEQDRAVRAVEQLVRRVEIRHRLLVQDAEESEDPADVVPAPSATPDGVVSPDGADTLGVSRDEVLIIALRVAVVRCRSLIDQLDRLCSGVPDARAE